jgi:hypothetical protein
MDVPIPARPGDERRPAEASWMIWARERRPLVIGGAFALAVLLGVVIGLATAPHGSGPPSAGATTAPAAELSPPLPTVPWSASRVPGTAQQMSVTHEPAPAAFRLALSWAAADAARAAAAGTTPGTSAPALPAAAITIPQNQLYYGAIEGTDAAHDEFWAAGLTQVSASAVPVPALQVWRRVGSGPWSVVRSGPGSCDALPNALYGPGAWKHRPGLCDTT